MKRIITKTILLNEVRNDKCHNWYYGFYGRIYNDNETRYKKCSFVLMVDSEDILEYYDGKENITQQDIRDYVKFLALENLYSDTKDYNNLKGFYAWCNDTIDRYNRMNDSLI